MSIHRPTLAALLPFAFLAASAHAATLVADYRFNNSFASSVGTAPDLTPIPQSGTTGDFSTETVNGIPNTPVFTFSGNRGLLADTASLLPQNDYSVVFYARLSITAPAGTPPLSPIIKILDFKNRTSDAGQYVVAGVPTFYDGLAPVLPGAGLFTDNTYAQFALTRSAAGAVTAYLNGAQLYTFNDTSNLATLDQNLLTLFADDPNSTILTTGLQIEAATGAIARLRLYSGALTPTEIAALDTLPVPEPTTALLLLLPTVTLLLRRKPTAR